MKKSHSNTFASLGLCVVSTIAIGATVIHLMNNNGDQKQTPEVRAAVIACKDAGVTLEVLGSNTIAPPPSSFVILSKAGREDGLISNFGEFKMSQTLEPGSFVKACKKVNFTDLALKANIVAGSKSISMTKANDIPGFYMNIEGANKNSVYILLTPGDEPAAVVAGGRSIFGLPFEKVPTGSKYVEVKY
ncbi:MAG: hypothetical protein ACRCXZ_06660 [Patescibacteria group bacterium]